jgi:hypothetical protein
MLEASAQNYENVKTRVYLGRRTCEIAKSKIHYLRERSGKMIRDGGKSSIFFFVKIDTFLTPQDQNTNPAKPPFNQTPVTAHYIHNVAFNTRST